MKNMNILNFVAVASLSILSSFPALAQDKDSCRNDSSARKNDDAGSVEVIDFDIPFYGRIKNKDNSQLELSGMGFGLIYANTGDPLDFNVSRSIEIQPFCFYAEKYWQRSSLSLGLGILSRNFTMTGDRMLSRDEDGRILAGPYPAGSKPKLSRLSVFSITVPLLYSYNIKNGYGFSVGPVVEFNTKSVLKAKYSVDGNKQKDKYEFVHCNPITVDLMAQINLKHFSLYVRYSPMDLMDNQWWPEMHQQVSFGVML